MKRHLLIFLAALCFPGPSSAQRSNERVEEAVFGVGQRPGDEQLLVGGAEKKTSQRSGPRHDVVHGVLLGQFLVGRRVGFV